MTHPVTLTEAKLFLRVEGEEADAEIGRLIARATNKIEVDSGLSLTSTSPAPLRLAILMLVLRAFESGDDAMPLKPVEAWVNPYRVERL